ncbi:MAG: hypothetical protein JXA82_04695 [Sedimentisphaerales bacterium]|nr:hypothetical protein [Sedimentisphaerales bacterium]
MNGLISTRSVLACMVVTGILAVAAPTLGELIHANGNVTLVAGSEYFPVSQASDGDPSTQWVTEDPGGYPSDYFDYGPVPVMVMDLGEDVALDAVAFWGYGISGNSTSEFSLRFAKEADGIGSWQSYNPTFHTGPQGNSVQQNFPFGLIVLARYVQVTVSDNHIETPPGGDRVGFGEIQFNKTDINIAHFPAPPDQSSGINPDGILLSWDAAGESNPSDPNVLVPNPGLLRHELYLSSGNPEDPNVLLLDTIAAGNPIAARVEYGPLNLDRDGTYYWRVDEVIRDPNGMEMAHTGDTWMFQTLPSNPEILSNTPADTLASLGGDATFTILATNPFLGDESGLRYQWYKVNPDGDDIEMGDDSALLTISNVTGDDEGQYYCIVTIIDPDVQTWTISRQANLVLKKRIGYWPFDGDATDLDFGNDGFIGGGTPDFTAQGVVNNGLAVQFDSASSEFIQIANDNLQWSPTGSFSVSMWVKATGGSGHRAPISNRHEPPTQGFIIYDEPGNTWQFWNGHGGASGWNTLQGPSVVNNEWTHLVITCDPTGISENVASDDIPILLATKRLYVNGELYDEQQDIEYKPKKTGTSDLFIGAGQNENPANFFFHGLVDDVRLYNYPIEDVKVAQLYTDVMGGAVCVESLRPAFDLDHDCEVTLTDFAILAENWAVCNLVPADNCP